MGFKRMSRIVGMCLFMLPVVFVQVSIAQEGASLYRVLHYFKGGLDGSNAYSGLVRDASGNLYGTTAHAGDPYCYCGTLFKISPRGKETVLRFNGNDGALPEGALLLDRKGNLYGTTLSTGWGGSGVLFKIGRSGTVDVLHYFGAGSDGGSPAADLMMDSEGNLYSTTESGGSYGFGTVFKFNTTTGEESVVNSFDGHAGGWEPRAGVIRDAAGNFYGTTAFGGTISYYCPSGCGVVYKVDSNGNETVLHTFTNQPHGSAPYGDLIRDGEGNLYGTTSYGGTYGFGTVFKLSQDGIETVLYSFTGGSDGQSPVPGVISDSEGNLYGTTFYGGDPTCGCGVVFKLDKAGNLTVLHSFLGYDGGGPTGRLIRDRAGNIYGTTDFGGVNGNGVVFKISPQRRFPVL